VVVLVERVMILVHRIQENLEDQVVVVEPTPVLVDLEVVLYGQGQDQQSLLLLDGVDLADLADLVLMEVLAAVVLRIMDLIMIIPQSHHQAEQE
tara:strand:+ start:264 stop:545 length:282 start_codon:yes stop_codon:yes gene_type:complete